MHILEAIERLQKYAGGLRKEELETDVLRYYGIVKNIEIIGEAARMLSTPFKETHTAVNWRMIANMRNFLVHEYFRVDLVTDKGLLPFARPSVEHDRILVYERGN